MDQTGLTGLWDFTLETAWPTQTPPQDAGLAGPTMLEAIQEQLGMKLEPRGLSFRSPLWIMSSGPMKIKRGMHVVELGAGCASAPL